MSWIKEKIKEHREKLSTITKRIKEFYKKKYGKDSTDLKSDKRVKEIMDCINSIQSKKILQNIKTFLEVSLDWKNNKNSKIDNKVKNNKNMVEGNIWKNLSTSDEISGTILEPITKNNYTVNPVKLGGNLPETTNNISAWRLNWLKEWSPRALDKFIVTFNDRCNDLNKLFRDISSNKKNIEKIIKYVQKYFISNGRLSKLAKLPSGPPKQKSEPCLLELKKHWRTLHSLADADVIKNTNVKDYLRGIIYQYKGFIVYAHDNPYSCGLFNKLLSNNFLGKDFKEKSKAYENEKKKGIPEKNKAAIQYWQTVVVPQRDIDLFEKMCKETSNSCQLQTFVQYMISAVIYVEKLEIDPSTIDLNQDIPEMKKACKLENFDSSILNKTLNKTINKIEDAQKGSRISRFAEWIKSKFKSKKDENKGEIKSPKKEGVIKRLFGSLSNKDEDRKEINEEILKLNEASKIFEEPMKKLSTGNLVNLNELAEINEKLCGDDVSKFIENYKKVDELIDHYDSEAAGNKKKIKWVEEIKDILINIGYKVSSLLTSFHQKSLESRNNFLKAFGNENINWNECIFYTTIFDANAYLENKSGLLAAYLRSLDLGAINIAILLNNASSIKVGPKPPLFNFIMGNIVNNLKTDSTLTNSVLFAGKGLVNSLLFGIDKLINGLKTGTNWVTNKVTGNEYFDPNKQTVLNWICSKVNIDLLDSFSPPMLGVSGNSEVHAHKIQDVKISFETDKIEMDPHEISISAYLVSIGKTMNNLVKAIPTNLMEFVQKDIGLNLNSSSQSKNIDTAIFNSSEPNSEKK